MPFGNDFSVNHGNYNDVNMGLVAEIKRMDNVMSDLNKTLNNIERASQGKATPLWENQQAAWNNSYLGMLEQLNTQTQSSINIHDLFWEADNQGGRIMS
jgi:uncharacterized protein YukE